MQPRMNNPLVVVQGAVQPLMALAQATKHGGVPATVLSLII
jgi:hypothetical protein